MRPPKNRFLGFECDFIQREETGFLAQIVDWTEVYFGEPFDA
jgi:hypothetical protein